MNISYNWLKEYIQIDKTPEKLAEILTELGLEVGSVDKVESIKGGLEGLVIGEVLSCEKHPDADKLSLTTVNIGNNEPLNIVCGAPNVAKGQKVVVATIGTIIYTEEGSFEIKKSKIRGSLSEGMLCAEDEIGLGKGHDGILTLPNDVVVGTLAKEYFKVKSDFILEVDITPNRADALSHIGVARDIATYLTIHESKTELTLPSFKMPSKGNQELKVDIQVKDSNSCHKYCGITIANVTIKESPDWLKNKLKSIGLKPINNVVDVTNFVLMETGQPLHAFDYDKIDGKIVVSKLHEGQKLILLDDKEIVLHSEDLVISDGKNPLCLAGVMGGKSSAVNNSTKNIFLEAAYFNAIDVRKSSKRHQTKSDSSYRFERGIDPNFTENAIQRALALIIETAGGSIASELITIKSSELNPFTVKFRYSKCNQVIGNELPKEKINQILTALEIKFTAINEDELDLQVPLYRVDVQRESDVIEEILRIYGYNNIELPSQLSSTIVFTDKIPAEKLQSTISDLLSSSGFNEILCNSLTRPTIYEGLDQFQEANNVELLNPLSNDLSVLRRSLLFGGLESVARNQNMKNPNLKLYEFGKIYWKNISDDATVRKYQEEKRLSLLITGNTQEDHWNIKNIKSDFYALKGYLQYVFTRLGISGLKLKASENPIFSDAVAIYSKKNMLAEYGKINAVILKSIGIKQDVFYADIKWDLLLNLARNNKIKYTELPKFHPVKRDLSLLLDNVIDYKQLETLAFETEREILKEVELFDVYQGKNVPENKKSYALSFILESKEETLKDSQIEKTMSKLIGSFESKLGAKLR